MQKKNPNFMKKSENKIPDDFQKEEADQVTVGTRCEVIIGSRRGVVKYVGKVPELAPGYWIGAHLDEPTGDSDGKVKGKIYFDSASKFGIFIRPKDAKFGDFPPVDDFDENEDEIWNLVYKVLVSEKSFFNPSTYIKSRTFLLSPFIIL